jgi:aryl-alcohol dehydrogenase-like predicted oxidoreductase
MPFGTVKLNDGNKVCVGSIASYWLNGDHKLISFQIPAIGYGTGSVWKRQDVTQYVEQAIDTGFEHIDTAQCWCLVSCVSDVLYSYQPFFNFYPQPNWNWTDYANEEYVGKAIKMIGLKRDEFFITTKYATGDVREAVNASLSKVCSLCV